jgi:LytS/YehU family sensor histidine kinase
MLQPLVENAIRHGRRPGGEILKVKVTVRSGPGGLELSVQDNGRGLREPRTEGVGLVNTRARLRQLYPGGHSFGLTDVAGGGAEARVTIPLRGNDLKAARGEAIFEAAPVEGAGS